MKHYTIRISGRVQNVGFRYFTVHVANELNISGYVKNEPSGSVFIEAEGDDGSLDTFVSRCKIGPNWARVDHMDVQETPLMNYTGFSVK